MITFAAYREGIEYILENATSNVEANVMLNKYVVEQARESLLGFVFAMFPGYTMTSQHEAYISILDMFASSKIKKLIVSMPPQHGKSEVATRILPCYLLGKNPDSHVALATYTATLAKDFCKKVQLNMDTYTYDTIFPNTVIKSIRRAAKDIQGTVRTSSYFNIYAKKGDFYAVGCRGPLTGKTVDIGIADDLYKDYREASSPTYREAVWDWYTSVFRTRLDNNARELLVFTRWNLDDIIGRLLKEGITKEITTIADADFEDTSVWYVVNLPAIQNKEASSVDPRAVGEALWPGKHSLSKLEEHRKLDPFKFEALYQGNPKPAEGLLYSAFITYAPNELLNANKEALKCYVDTADKGNNFLCAIIYWETEDFLYVVDVLYTQEPMEVTEEKLAVMVSANNVDKLIVESNNGGEQFARSVLNKMDEKFHFRPAYDWYHQSENKEARVITSVTAVCNFVKFPFNWTARLSLFFEHLSNFNRDFRSNLYDDAPDALAGCIENSKFAVDAKNKFYC